MSVFPLAAVSAQGIFLQPSVEFNLSFLQRHLESQFIIQRILLNAFHKQSAAANIRRKTDRRFILITGQQRQIPVHIDPSAEIMKITGYDRISPAGIALRTFTAIQIQYQQMFFRHRLHDRFSQTPGLHSPQGMRIKFLEKSMNGTSDSRQIFRRIYRRTAFMERICRIDSMRTKQFLFFFKEISSYHLKKRIRRIKLRCSLKSTPGRLRLYLQFTGNISGESLLDRFHSQFQLPSDDLLSQNHMLIDP